MFFLTLYIVPYISQLLSHSEASYFLRANFRALSIAWACGTA